MGRRVIDIVCSPEIRLKIVSTYLSIVPFFPEPLLVDFLDHCSYSDAFVFVCCFLLELFYWYSSIVFEESSKGKNIYWM